MEWCIKRVVDKNRLYIFHYMHHPHTLSVMHIYPIRLNRTKSHFANVVTLKGKWADSVKNNVEHFVSLHCAQIHSHHHIEHTLSVSSIST